MEWVLDKNKPLCPQICEQICVRIALGVFKPEDRLLSVRETAMAAGVNPNTVQRSYEVLEQQGVLYSVRGSGWYVAADTALAMTIMKRILSDKTAAYFKEMSALGMSAEDVKTYVKEWEEHE